MYSTERYENLQEEPQYIRKCQDVLDPINNNYVSHNMPLINVVDDLGFYEFYPKLGDDENMNILTSGWLETEEDADNIKDEFGEDEGGIYFKYILFAQMAATFVSLLNNRFYIKEDAVRRLLGKTSILVQKLDEKVTLPYDIGDSGDENTRYLYLHTDYVVYMFASPEINFDHFMGGRLSSALLIYDAIFMFYFKAISGDLMPPNMGEYLDEYEGDKGREYKDFLLSVYQNDVETFDEILILYKDQRSKSDYWSKNRPVKDLFFSHILEICKVGMEHYSSHFDFVPLTFDDIPNPSVVRWRNL